MATLNVFEVIDKAGKARSKAQKVAILKENDHWAIRDILNGTFNDRIKWNLPPGAPPYTPNDGHNAPSNLYKKNTDFKHFVLGGPGDRMPAFKREKIFIGLIEAIHPKDAELVIAMINKEKPKGITRNVVEEAYPGLLS